MLFCNYRGLKNFSRNPHSCADITLEIINFHTSFKVHVSAGCQHNLDVWKSEFFLIFMASRLSCDRFHWVPSTVSWSNSFWLTCVSCHDVPFHLDKKMVSWVKTRLLHEASFEICNYYASLALTASQGVSHSSRIQRNSVLQIPLAVELSKSKAYALWGLGIEREKHKSLVFCGRVEN